MKITAVEPILLTMPMSGRGAPATTAAPAIRKVSILLVRVDTDEGLSGWGEVSGQATAGVAKTIINEIIAPIVLGSDVDEMEEIGDRVRFRTHTSGFNGSILHGLSGIDTALWDLASKSRGLPLYRWLGGKARTSIGACASIPSFGDPATVAQVAGDAVRNGYREVKLHERGAEEVAAARSALGGDIGLTLDVNCRWTLDDALGLVDALAPYNLRWVEDPIWSPEDHDALARLHAAGMRVAAAENTGTLFDYKHLFEMGAVDVAAPDVTKVGGVTAMLKVIALADAHRIPVYPHSASFGPGRMATLHLLAARAPRSSLQQLFLEPEALLISSYGDPTEGALAVPQGPGLGADPDPEVIARYRVG